MDNDHEFWLMLGGHVQPEERQASLVREFDRISAMLTLNDDGSLREVSDDVIPSDNPSTGLFEWSRILLSKANQTSVSCDDIENLNQSLERERERNIGLRKELEESKVEAQAREDELKREKDEMQRILRTAQAIPEKMIEILTMLLQKLGLPVPSWNESEEEKSSSSDDENVVRKLDRAVKFLVDCRLEECTLMCSQTRNEGSEVVDLTVEESANDATLKSVESACGDKADQVSAISSEVTLSSTRSALTSTVVNEDDGSGSQRRPHKKDVTKQGFVCTCGASFDNEKDLKMHIRDTKERKFECEVCPAKFLFLSHLRRHMYRTHKKQLADSHGCSLCGARFQSATERYRHRVTAHKKYELKGLKSPVAPLEALNIPTSKMTTTMKRCNPPKSCSASSPPGEGGAILKIPHGVDVKKRGFTCKCGRRYNTRLSLNNHIRYFLAPRHFVCGLCRWRFINASFLEKHLSTVHKIAKFRVLQCSRCTSSFKTILELAKHSQTVHFSSTISVGLQKSQIDTNSRPGEIESTESHPVIHRTSEEDRNDGGNENASEQIAGEDGERMIVTIKDDPDPNCDVSPVFQLKPDENLQGAAGRAEDVFRSLDVTRYGFEPEDFM